MSFFNNTKEKLKIQMENNKKQNEHIMDLKKRNTQLQLDIVDLKAFREQDKVRENALRDEIFQLKKELTIYKRKLTIEKKKGNE